MLHLDFRESIRRQLQVGPDGVVSAIAGEPRSTHELARCLGGVGNIFESLPAATTLAASTPLPERLLLFFSLSTAEDRMRAARVAAQAVGFLLGLFPAFLASVMIVESRKGALIPATVVSIGIVVVLAVWAYRRSLAKVGQVWEYSEWIDFTSRTWHSRRHFNDGSLPDVMRRFPLDSLGLYVYSAGFIDGAAYGVAIGQINMVEDASKCSWPFLITIHESDSKIEICQFGVELAALWGLTVIFDGPRGIAQEFDFNKSHPDDPSGAGMSP